MFGIGAADGADCAQFADAVGGADGARAFDASITVGSVGRVQLVTTSDPFDSGKFDDRIVFGKCVVAGYSKNLRNPERFETRENMLNDGYRDPTLFW